MLSRTWSWLRGARLLPAGCVLAVLALGLYAVDLRAPVVPDVLVTIVLNLLYATYTLACWRAWRTAVDPTGRRFWRTMALSALGLVVGRFLDLSSYLAGPIPSPTVFEAIYSVVPLGLVVVALYRLPLGARSRGERQRLLLDIATVTLAAALFGWYLVHTSQRAAGGSPPGLVGAVLVLIAVLMFGLVKAIMSGTRTVEPVALRLVTLALVVEIVGLLLASLVHTRQHYGAETALVPVFLCMMTAAAECQRRAAGRPAVERDRGHRPFSLLPYLAVAAVDGLMLVTLWREAPVRLTVSIVAAALTAVVVVRQIGAFRDNARLLDELRAQERRFRSLVQNAEDVIAITTGDGLITYITPGVRDLTGVSAEEMLGTTGPQVHPDDLPTANQAVAAVLADPGHTARYEVRVRHRDGTWRRTRMTTTNMLTDPAIRGMVTNCSDITESYDIHQMLSHQASHDALTDLANRSLLAEQLDLALRRREGRPVTLALVDLDDFKTVNDTLGHQAGDALLVAVAERLRGGVRPHDLVARLGGDEFAVLLDGVAGETVDAIADRMLSMLTAPITIDGHDVGVAASVGIAEAAPDEDADRLMRHADLALYAAKGAGKARYVRYAKDMRPRTSARADAAVELRRALAAEEFELHYQPIVALPSGRTMGVEALLRWRHPDRGLVPPLDFIPAAEDTGMIVPIGRWVLAQACRDAARWLAEFPDTAPRTINVNVSPVQLGSPDFADHVIAALDEAGLPPERLMIELVENTLVADVSGQLRRLRDLGVRVALDDFGTGHSTLGLLDACPVDELKLDRSFVRDPEQDKVATVVATMARVLGIHAVAEGIETSEQAEHLHRLGYRLAQGFHFARPVPAAEIAAALRGDRITVPG